MRLLADIPSLGWDGTLFRLAGAGFWAAAVIATAAGLAALRPLEWVKNHLLPRRAPDRLVIELTEAGSPRAVLDALEESGGVLALRRDGKRLEVELAVAPARR